ncbi:MAG: hypothetical protein QXJ68_08570 [Methanocellales archaeon]
MYLETNLSLENIFHAITLLSIALLSSGHKMQLNIFLLLYFAAFLVIYTKMLSQR